MLRVASFEAFGVGAGRADLCRVWVTARPRLRSRDREAKVAASDRRMLSRCEGERGQAVVFVVVALTVLMAMAAFGIDVGSWYQTKRHDQAVADAAALAGAQALPDDPAAAVAAALDYGNRNGLNLSSGDVSISTDRTSSDTITVSFTRPAPTFFARVVGLNSVTIGATAAARSDVTGAARWVAPIAVSSKHPMLQCNPPPCSGNTQLTLISLKNPGSANAAGNFTLLDLIPGDNGNIGNSTLADWLQNGYDQAMPLGIYDGAPGTDFNSSTFDQALQNKIGTEILFPVYQPPVFLGGSNASFNIIGWVGFRISGYGVGGNSGTITGSFTRYIAEGLQATNPNSQTDFGARTVQLVR
jgi:Flp pilus assembly protein TadG